MRRKRKDSIRLAAEVGAGGGTDGNVELVVVDGMVELVADVGGGKSVVADPLA